MRIAIIGCGRLGSVLARRWGRAGHEVLVSARRGVDALAPQVDGWEHVRAAPRMDASTADVAVLAFPWRERGAALDGVVLSGSVVVDATNPFSQDFDVLDAGPDGSTGAIAAELPGARMVKALNSVPADHLDEPADPSTPTDERLGVPIASDDHEAKDLVHDLVAELGHTGVDVGGLDDGRQWMQPQCPLFMIPATAAELRQRVEALRQSV
jgi:8-hydroxy-5-deazaflavin:NADPH oxidoreductase